MAEWTDPKRVCVLVCGERLRGDDAAAVLACEDGNVSEVYRKDIPFTDFPPPGTFQCAFDTSVPALLAKTLMFPL